MQLFLFITVVIMIAFGTVHFQNPDITVSMKFITWIFESKPIALILAVPFAVGLLAGTLFFVPPWMKKASLARHQKKRIQELETAIAEQAAEAEEDAHEMIESEELKEEILG